MPFDEIKPYKDSSYTLPVVDENLRVTGARERAKSRIENDMASILDDFFPRDEYTSVVTDPNTNEVRIVVDVGYIQDKLETEFRLSNVRVSIEKLALAFFERHKNERVLTPEQVSVGDYESKPLFYYPDSLDAATSSVELADTKFQMPLWELHKNGVFTNRDCLYPTKNGESLSAFEAKAALRLLHPKYGDGRRNPKDERLYVKNPHHNPDNSLPRRTPLSRKVLQAYGLREVIEKKKGGIARGIREGIEAELPNLIANGELRTEDIRQVSVVGENELLWDFDPKPIGTNSYVMIGGVNHYVGRKFGGDTATSFSETQAVVMHEVDGESTLVAAFNLVNKSNASDVYIHESGNTVARANVDKTQPKEIQYENLVVPESYAEGLQEALRPEKIKELQQLVTERFTSLNNLAERAEELVRSESVDSSEEKIQENTTQVRQILKSQAAKVIEIASSAMNAESLKSSLESFTFDARAYVALLHSLGVEKMLSSPLREVTAKQLSPKEKDVMINLLRQNYEAMYPGEAHQKFRTEVENSLRHSFENISSRFYLLEDDGEIVSFNRFDELDDGRWLIYFGSFNADPKYRGVGSTMLEHTIQEKMGTCEAMFAHCDPHMPISQKYIEDGFVAVQTETVAGNFSFEIWRSPEVSKKLSTKKMSKEDLVAAASQPHKVEDDYFVREVNSDDTFEELDSGLSYLLTRYFTYEGKRYATFEINPELSKEFERKVVT